MGKEGRSEFSVGDIFRRFGQQYELTHPMRQEHRKALHDISVCRTDYLGGHLEKCHDCGFERPVYNSCGNVSCPMCQGIKRRRWLDERLTELLPVSYFHCIFTVPHEGNDLAYYNQRLYYNLIFRHSANTLLHFAKEEHNAVPAITATLHTWGQNLMLHPHVHVLVTSGGLGEDGKWKHGSDKYLYDVEEMSAYFKKRFLHSLELLKKRGKLEHAEKFQEIYDQMDAKEWVVHCKKPFAGAEKVVEYLSRYVYRSAIANSRIEKVDQSGVSFDYKDYKDKDKKGIPRHKSMFLKPMEFMRRFLQHILPKGFRRCRFYGLFAGAERASNLEYCQTLFASELTQLESEKTEPVEKQEKEECPYCGCCKFSHIAEIRKERAPPPITFHKVRKRLYA
jgi:hypothetical protein